MKVVILAGGLGTRIGEESRFKPKPMIELGGMPILWHVMKLYSHYGFPLFLSGTNHHDSWHTTVSSRILGRNDCP
jgi:NDP-sugar pyrophosphorylase family protein